MRLSDDQMIGGAALLGMVAYPFVMPWIEGMARLLKGGAKRRHPSTRKEV